MPDAVAARLNTLGLAATPDEIAAVAGEVAGIRERLAALAVVLTRDDGVGVFDDLLRAAAAAGEALPGEAEPPARTPGLQESAPEAIVAGVERALTAAHDRGDALNAFIAHFDEAARRRAQAVARRAAADAPLRGVPYAFKDAFATAGRRPTVGIGEGHRWPGRRASTTLARLDAAGAVAIGALNLDPHCYTAVGLNPHFGRVLNPHDPRVAVGGSSSGAAAAVAAGIVPFAIGTDTGGSVRIPASLCGIYGFKPTHGLLTDPGLAPLCRSQDTPGILAESLAMTERVFSVLAPSAAPPAAPGRLRIGVCREAFAAGLDADVAAVFEATLARLVAGGADIVEVPFPSFDALNLCASIITGFEATLVHAAAMACAPQFYPAPVRRRLLTAACIDVGLYRKARRLRGRFLAEVLATSFAAADVLICPTLRKAAPRVDHLAEDDIPAAGALGLEFLRMNRPFSLLGLPALSVPSGVDGRGLPVGLQWIGRPHGDRTLLASIAGVREARSARN
jgi:Asp-tRNA(Asn)/Glu-tRNA(Gln) amidotransferase A subunit family amidase